MPELPATSLEPDGFSRRCPVCQALVVADPSEPTGDAPCPRCGHLIWWFEDKMRAVARASNSSAFTIPDTVFLNDLAADSLDIVELLMEYEEEFGISIPDDDYGTMRTLGDVIRYLNRRHRGL